MKEVNTRVGAQGKQKIPELLSPAGNLEKLEAALLFGADAVYLSGERFGLRSGKTGFSREDLLTGFQRAHQAGAKAYVTLNVVAHEEDLAGLPEYANFLAQAGADAVIISDPGIFSIVHKTVPDLEIHLSTQANTCNSAACNFWYDQGVKRIVLARELSLEEIRTLRREIPADMELEAFVHGAMCMAYSGRCLLSNALTGRDANQGACAQACRWDWKLSREDHGDVLYINEDQAGTYFFNSRDLCLIDHIPALAQAGIDSFKIEGRMKGAFYAAVTAKAYREALDLYRDKGDLFTPDPNWQVELNQMVHRTYDTGYYFSSPHRDAKIDEDLSYHKEAVVCARVTEGRADSRYIICEQRNKLSLGESVDLIRPHGSNLRLVISHLFDENLQPIEATPHAKMTFAFLREDLQGAGVNEDIPAGSFVRREGDKD